MGFPARAHGEKLGLLPVAKGANNPLDLVARFMGTVCGVDGCAVAAANGAGLGLVAAWLGGGPLGCEFAAVPDELGQRCADGLGRRVAPMMRLARFF